MHPPSPALKADPPRWAPRLAAAAIPVALLCIAAVTHGVHTEGLTRDKIDNAWQIATKQAGPHRLWDEIASPEALIFPDAPLPLEPLIAHLARLTHTDHLGHVEASEARVTIVAPGPFPAAALPELLVFLGALSGMEAGTTEEGQPRVATADRVLADHVVALLVALPGVDDADHDSVTPTGRVPLEVLLRQAAASSGRTLLLRDDRAATLQVDLDAGLSDDALAEPSRWLEHPDLRLLARGSHLAIVRTRPEERVGGPSVAGSMRLCGHELVIEGVVDAVPEAQRVAFARVDGLRVTMRARDNVFNARVEAVGVEGLRVRCLEEGEVAVGRW
jgi:hypothetical protein